MREPELMNKMVYHKYNFPSFICILQGLKLLHGKLITLYLCLPLGDFDWEVVCADTVIASTYLSLPSKICFESS